MVYFFRRTRFTLDGVFLFGGEAVPHHLLVGEPYLGAERVWPETVQLSWNHGRYELLMCFREPSADEVTAIRQERLRLAAGQYRSVLFWGWQFGSLPWGDSPYSWHFQREADPTLPLPSAEAVSRPLLVILLDSRNGRIRALRLLSLPVFFVTAWEKAMHRQARMKWDAAQYDAELQLLYGMYPTVRLVRELTFVRCQIGRDTPGVESLSLN
jgi:hypothetical protein